MEEGLSAII